MKSWILDLENAGCASADRRQHESCLQHHELIRVATKYPHIAKDYFYNKKHQTVEIIKLNGSIELAPIVGLSEVIVRYRGDRLHTPGKRIDSVRGSVSALCPHGSQSGEHEDGK